MKPLKTEFQKNDMLYKILERTTNFYFAELRSTDSGNVVAYESGRIVKNKARTGTFEGVKVKFEEGESIVSNEKFGQHPVDRAYIVVNKDKCYQHFLKYARKDQKMNINSKTNNKSKCNEAVHTN